MNKSTAEVMFIAFCMALFVCWVFYMSIGGN